MKQNKLLRSMLYNWQVKLLALVLAVAFYLVVEYATVSQRIVRIPLDVVYPQSLTAVSTVPETVEITLSGSDRELFLLDASYFNAVVDFSASNQEGVAQALVVVQMPDDLLLPSDIGVSVRPSQVKVFLQRVSEDAGVQAGHVPADDGGK